MNTPNNDEPQIDPALERAIQAGLDDEELEHLLQQAVRPEVKKKYSLPGSALFDDSCVRPMSLEDVDNGVRAIYEDAEIDPAYLLAMQKGQSARLDEYLKSHGSRRGGMLHRWDVAPVSALTAGEELLSVRDEMLKLLKDSCSPETIQDAADIVRQCRHDIHKTFQYGEGSQAVTLYKGAILAPIQTPETVLAYGTWEEPNDSSIYENIIAGQLQEISTDDGVKMEETDYVEKADRTVLFDTICGAQEGAASLLLQRLVPYWRQSLSAERILLYRHKLLRVMSGLDPSSTQQKIGIPTGNNDTSERFFRNRGLTEIGTQQSKALAPFTAAEDGEEVQYSARSTFGWMMGELETVEDRCNTIVEGAKKKFCSQ